MEKYLILTLLSWLVIFSVLGEDGLLDTLLPSTQTDATPDLGLSPSLINQAEQMTYTVQDSMIHTPHRDLMTSFSSVDSMMPESMSSTETVVSKSVLQTDVTTRRQASVTDQADNPVSCDGAVCKTSPDVILINSSMCQFFPSFQLNATSTPATVHTWPNPYDSQTVICKWKFAVAKHHQVLITFEQGTVSDGSVFFEFKYNEYKTVSIYSGKLAEKVVNMTINSDVQVQYQNDNPPYIVNVTFHYVAIQILLPSVQVSDSTGYVTSPGYSPGVDYPKNYDGTYGITVPNNHSVIIRFTHFDLQPHGCESDFVMLYKVNENSDNDTLLWKKCGEIDIPFQIFRSSIQLRFVTDGYHEGYTGFKMKYAILPTQEEPRLVADGTRDCSVPYFEKFSYVFRCNLVPECEHSEDEKDCDYQYLSLNNCSKAVCQTGRRFFVIDMDKCSPADENRFDAFTDKTTVVFNVKPGIMQSHVMCEWHIVIPKRYTLHVTFLNVTSDIGSTKININNDLSLDKAAVQNKTVTLMYQSTTYFKYVNHKPYTSTGIAFSFHLELNILPAGNLSDTAGFVTSPKFPLYGQCPENYEGIFDINVPENFSVITKVEHLSINGYGDCGNDFVLVAEKYNESTMDQTRSRMCGYDQRKPVIVFNNSVRVLFQSSTRHRWEGFKLRYATLPTHLLPQISSNNLYNCSVAHFDLFRPVISCDFLVDCQAGEDETGCDYSGNGCGPAGLEIGTKCLTLVRPDKDLTWYTANSICKNKQQQLVTIANNETIHKMKEIEFVYDTFDFYVGLQLTTPPSTPPLSTLYIAVWRWVDGRSAFSVQVHAPDQSTYQLDIPFPLCTRYAGGSQQFISSVRCFQAQKVDIMCEYDKSVKNKALTLDNPAVKNSSVTFSNITMVPCGSGHVTRDFLVCDGQSQCDAETQTSCQTEVKRMFMFQCLNGEQIPYTLVCDFVIQCTDGSDESFCQFKPCTSDLFQCQNRQCVDIKGVCDGKQDCFDSSDEICQLSIDRNLTTVQPPAVITMHGNGNYSITSSSVCPDTHFSCLDDYCFPIFLRCNGIHDCVGGEDEADCNTYSCEGFYRCRGSKECLHPKYMCDGIFHCPQYDDELLCQEPACPTACSCQGLAFHCSKVFNIGSCPSLRYLSITNARLSTDFVSQSWFLVSARLSHAGITRITTLSLPNLQQLDLSYNGIASVNVQSLAHLKNLRRLVLTGNPLLTIFTEVITSTGDSLSADESTSTDNVQQMRELDLSFSHLESYNSRAFSSYPQLEVLNISNSKLYAISDEGFLSTPKLKMIDLRNSKLKVFPNDLLKNLTKLRTVYADNFVFCCQAMLPDGFDTNQCHSKQDFLASCEDLLRSDTYRAFLWNFGLLSVMGNMGSFIARMYLSKEEKKLGSFGIFVSNLSVADFLMGVYLIIIGVADQVFLGDFLWHSEQWKSSAACSVAGFLSLLSSEVSAFIICLITLDRFLVLCFPFSTFHFQKKSALVACSIAWTLGIILAGIPLMPFASHWNYYSQTGICIPLPFSTGEDFEGQPYSFAVMIVINFVVFLLIAVGQAVIFWSIQMNSMSTSKDSTSKNAIIARRLTTIVVSDFLCWFPIGLLGLLSATGTQIPGEIKVAVAVFVLPFNSALNPFLYTFNTVMEKRQKAIEEQLFKRLEATYRTKLNASTKTSTVKATVSSQLSENTDEQSTGTAASFIAANDTRL